MEFWSAMRHELPGDSDLFLAARGRGERGKTGCRHPCGGGAAPENTRCTEPVMPVQKENVFVLAHSVPIIPRREKKASGKGDHAAKTKPRHGNLQRAAGNGRELGR
jgi:hypothetical protein